MKLAFRVDTKEKRKEFIRMVLYLKPFDVIFYNIHLLRHKEKSAKKVYNRH